ncbi:MAG: hypothetical protein Q7S40_03565 [Opitutaceae bacterium]|nr:hypothetical protein [Opitutaceae bacterium]
METSLLRTAFLYALGLLLIALKLCGILTWAWAWILAPLWIPVVLRALDKWLGRILEKAGK